MTIPPAAVALPPERITPPVDSNKVAVTTMALFEVARLPKRSSTRSAGWVVSAVLVMLPTGFVVTLSDAGSAWVRTSALDATVA